MAEPGAPQRRLAVTVGVRRRFCTGRKYNRGWCAVEWVIPAPSTGEDGALGHCSNSHVAVWLPMISEEIPSLLGFFFNFGVF